MQELAEFVAALFDYLRAEGRALRRALGGVWGGLLLLWVAAVVLLAALGFLFGALYLALLAAMPPAWASLVTGLVALLAAGGIAWIAKLNLR